MKVKSDDIVSPEQWLLDREFGVWYRFDEIPAAIFDQVFELIDERFRGYLYFFDDFDEAFKKEVFYKRSFEERSFGESIRQRYDRKKKESIRIYYLNLKHEHNKRPSN